MSYPSTNGSFPAMNGFFPSAGGVVNPWDMTGNLATWGQQAGGTDWADVLDQSVEQTDQDAPGGAAGGQGADDDGGGAAGAVDPQDAMAAVPGVGQSWFNTGQSAGVGLGNIQTNPMMGYVGGTPQPGPGQIPGGMSNPYTPYGQGQLLSDYANQINDTIGWQLNQNAQMNLLNDKYRANYELMDKLIDTIGNFGGSGGGGGGMRGFYDVNSKQAAALPGVHQTDVDTSPVNSVGEAVAKAYGTPAPAPGTNGSLPGVSSKATAALNRQYNDANAAAGSQNALATELMGRQQNAKLVRGAEQARAAQGLDNSRFMANLHGQNTNNNLRRLSNQVYAQTALAAPLLQRLSGAFA